MVKNLFVLGLDDVTRAELACLPDADRYVFHSLLAPEELSEASSRGFVTLLDKARRQLKAFDGPVDGLVAFRDFPGPELRSCLCRELGLPGASPEALVESSHKLRSRLAQRAAAPELVPAFEAVDPFEDDPLADVTLPYPFFLKPVHAHAGFLARHVAGPDDFAAAVSVIRRRIDRLGRPYGEFLREAGLAGARLEARGCIAEEVLGGQLIVVEGRCHQGEVAMRGPVAAHRVPGTPALAHHEYPVALPEGVAERLFDLTGRLVRHIGYLDAFSVEFFHDPRHEQVRLLQINPRVSLETSGLFREVDGAPGLRAGVLGALGERLQPLPRQGRSRFAATFYIREFQDGIVSHVPSADTVQDLETEFAGVRIRPEVATGQRLGELEDQEPCGFRLGTVSLGGSSPTELRESFERIRDALDFRVRPAPPTLRGSSARPGAEGGAGPRTLTRFPHEIESIEHVWIPMRDGVRLSARIWRPVAAEHEPVPAILEYIPYRKRDHTRYPDETAYTYLAGHGYACLRVDMRGSGESEGVLEDEYLLTEHLDGLDVLRWIGEQPWCDGNVGMVGISWGGFNGLQIAALRPPELKAVITVCSTDDRYGDDVHYMGGCLLADNLSWASTMFSRNAQPPDPEIVGDRWLEMWRQRLEGSGLWVAEWMRHPWRDEYWKHGSVCEDLGRIQCPVLAVGGWADGYTNAVFRLLEGLESPCKGIIGPWSHVYPHFGTPGPAIGFLQESRRWWDHWLKGVDSGIMEEPALTLWLQDYAPPRTSLTHRPGRWISLDSWPSGHVAQKALWLAEDGGLSVNRPEPAAERPFKVQSPLSVGLFGGKWSFYAVAPDLPHDQREEDGGAVVFESEPLEQDLSVVGSPVVELDLASNRPTAMLAVRLTDVSPDDKATRITFGLLNLTHRDGHETPEPLVPGQRYPIRLSLKKIAQVVPKGHRLRIAISSSYWPIAWPSPEPTRLTIFTGTSRVLLPELPPDAETPPARGFAEPVVGPSGRFEQLGTPDRSWMIQRDMMDETTSVMIENDSGTVHIEDIDMKISKRAEEKYSYRYDDYDSLRGETRTAMIFERDGRKAETRTHTVLTSTKTRFRVRATLDAYLDGSRIYSRSWDESIPRRLV